MIPTTVEGLPHWVQLVAVVTAVLAFILSALAFVLVVWPAIRNGERRARRMEEFLDSSEGKELIRAAKSKVMGLAAGGKPVDKDSFLRESTGVNEPGEKSRA